MNKKGFTLIELLVVIAIIAILAAILFPVFAQAKQAAKKAASTSNSKQACLAELMYSGDYDDMNVVAIAWGLSGAAVSYGGTNYSPWSWLVLPYMKNADALQDPQAPPNAIWPSPWQRTVALALEPQYGYNYTYLSQLNGPSPTTSTWTVYSNTTLADVANTVLFTAKFGQSETNLGWSGLYWYGANWLTTSTTVDSPHCATIPQWCFGDWGTGGFFDATYLKKNEQAGARTGGVSLRGPGNAVVTWCDGHVSTKSPGSLASGTNWTRTTASSSVVINDLTKFVWDLL